MDDDSLTIHLPRSFVWNTFTCQCSVAEKKKDWISSIRLNLCNIIMHNLRIMICSTKTRGNDQLRNKRPELDSLGSSDGLYIAFARQGPIHLTILSVSRITWRETITEQWTGKSVKGKVPLRLVQKHVTKADSGTCILKLFTRCSRQVYAPAVLPYGRKPNIHYRGRWAPKACLGVMRDTIVSASSAM